MRRRALLGAVRRHGEPVGYVLCSCPSPVAHRATGQSQPHWVLVTRHSAVQCPARRSDRDPARTVHSPSRCRPRGRWALSNGGGGARNGRKAKTTAGTSSTTSVHLELNISMFCLVPLVLYGLPEKTPAKGRTERGGRRAGRRWQNEGGNGKQRFSARRVCSGFRCPPPAHCSFLLCSSPAVRFCLCGGEPFVATAAIAQQQP
jgi:hypothetical protein